MEIIKVKSQFEKGQVWMVRENTYLTKAKVCDHHNHIIAYTRPYLILSVNDFNDMLVVQGMPITSKVRDDLCDKEIQLKFINLKNEENAVVISQIHPLNVENIYEYMYSMPSELMTLVDEYLMKRLGIGNTEHNEKRTDSSNDITIESIIKNTKLTSDVDNSEIENIIDNTIVPKETFRRRYIKWTINKKYKFVKMYERSANKKDVADAYDITVETAHNYYSKFKKFLKEMNISLDKDYSSSPASFTN